MKKLLVFLCAVMLVFGVIGNAHALSLINNGNFDNGLNDWTAGGDVEVVSAGSPWFTDVHGMDGNYALMGANSTDGTSTLSQKFEVSGIDSFTISFNWAIYYFDASSSANDTFLSIIGEDGNSAHQITMQQLTTHGTSYVDTHTGMAHGYYTETINISSYYSPNPEETLMFKLIEGVDVSTFSAAGVDNVNVAPVPEPSTILLLGSGLLGLVGYNRKRFSKKS